MEIQKTSRYPLEVCFTKTKGLRCIPRASLSQWYKNMQEGRENATAVPGGLGTPIPAACTWHAAQKPGSGRARDRLSHSNGITHMQTSHWRAMWKQNKALKYCRALLFHVLNNKCFASIRYIEGNQQNEKRKSNFCQLVCKWHLIWQYNISLLVWDPSDRRCLRIHKPGWFSL